MPGPLDQARPPRDAYGALDLLEGKLIHIAAVGGSIETWLFDVCTNTWSLAQRGTEPPFETIVSHAYDVEADREILVDDERAWAYDVRAGTWVELTPPPERVMVRLAYDTGAGQVVARSRSAPYPMWAYDAGTDAWVPLTQSEGDPGTSDGHLAADLFTFDGSTGRFLAYEYDTGHVALFDREAGIWQAVASPPRLNLGWLAGGNEIAYDEADGRSVIFSDGQVVAYDAAADRWATLYEERASETDALPVGPLARHYHSVVYDPLNQRLVVLGGEVRTPYGPWVHPDDIWAFDPRTGEWIELLAPTRSYPGHDAFERGK